ncbi:MAG: AbrB/MazE/SpoVT family DNA-binding domain-containing protein [Promethearchaeota archaeon]
MSKFGKDKFFFGSVKVGDRGQIVIPIEARKVFNINSGDQILVFGDKNKGIGLVKSSKLKNFAMKFFKSFNLDDYSGEEGNNEIEEE